jgi:6,7-dimethyl-8-ribityllumazine synthase
LVSDKKSLSALPSLPDSKGMRFGIIVSEWNNEITESLFKGARQTLLDAGVSEEHIFRRNVPGSFELPLGAKFFLDEMNSDAVICIGCVIQGETKHFDFICNAVSNGIMKLGLDYSVPVIFGVLTTNTMQQAVDRSGGKFGNKGIEAAVTAIQMAALRKNS